MHGGDPTSWRAKWCFTRKHLSRPWNQYAHFRRAVDLATEPRRAVIRISADARYILYVNGRRIHQGPARSYQRLQSYDTLDITHLLRAGPNAICAIVHQFGVPTFQSIYREISGLIVDGAIELERESIPLHTPDGWLCRAARGWRQDVARHSAQLGFQEHFDAGVDSDDWFSPDVDTNSESGWKEPMLIGPIGVTPWLHMEERGVPLLADHVERFASVVGQFAGESARGFESSLDVYHLPLREPRNRDSRFISDPLAMMGSDSSVATIQAPSTANFIAIVLELGQYRTGHVMIDIADAAGGEVIDLVYTEAIDDEGFPLIVPEDSHCEESTADRYRCRRGAQKWEPFAFHGMRYATLIIRNLSRPLKIRHVAFRQVHADVKDHGRFECSDEKLNRIWHVARETQRNCLFDSFVDCPWREQAMWWGDARVQSRVTLHAFGDLSFLERGIRLVARSQDEDGSLHSHPPADAPWHRLPDFMMTWVATLWDWHFHTGRTELLHECLPAMHRLFEFFDGHESPDGLIGSFDGWWVFLDWADLYRDNFSAVLNLTYLEAMRLAAAICRAANDDAAQARYEQKSDRLAASIERLFWNSDRRVWRDGFDAMRGKPIEQISQHANAMAVLLGLKPEHHARIAKECLIEPARNPASTIVTGSPYFHSIVIEALIATGLRRESIDLIREKWGQLLDAGATTFPEHWNATTGSHCHAWSGSPLYHLSEEVLGVMPIEPGWKRVRIAPFCETLHFARGTVPSPQGLVHIEWEKLKEGGLDVQLQIPPEMHAEFVSPSGQARQLAPGTHQFRA